MQSNADLVINDYSHQICYSNHMIKLLRQKEKNESWFYVQVSIENVKEDFRRLIILYLKWNEIWLATQSRSEIGIINHGVQVQHWHCYVICIFLIKTCFVIRGGSGMHVGQGWKNSVSSPPHLDWANHAPYGPFLNLGPDSSQSPFGLPWAKTKS